MSVNVQLANELRRLSGDNLTTSQIMLALGYTPANDTEFLAHVGNSTIHVTEEDRRRWNSNGGAFSGNYNNLIYAPDIFDDGSQSLQIADPQGNIIATIDSNGIKSINFWIGNTDIVTYVKARFGSIDYASLTNLPGIKRSPTGTTLCYDQNGNVVGEFDNLGLNVTGVRVGGIDIVQKINDLSTGGVTDYTKLSNIPPIFKSAWGTAVVKDPAGAQVAEFLSNGLSVNNLFIQGQSIASMIAASTFGGDYNQLINRPNIEETDNSRLLITDNDGNIVAEINSIGIRAIAFYSGSDGTDLSSSVKSLQQIQNQHLTDTNIHITAAERQGWNATSTSFSSHSSTSEIHVTSTDKQRWNLKSEFSGKYTDLTGQPNITQEASGDFLFKSAAGETISTLTAAGALYVSYIYVSGEKINLLERLTNSENAFTAHSTDSTIHITAMERETWNQVVGHIANNVPHITNEERTKWNNKSSFSGSYLDLLDKPEILKDSTDDSFIIRDNSGYKILQVDADGAHFPKVFIKGADGADLDVGQALEEKASTQHTHNYAGSATPGGAANSAQQLTFDNSAIFTWDSNTPIQAVGIFCVEITINGSEVVQFFLRASNSISTLTTPYFFSESRKQWVRFSFTRDANNLWSRSVLYYLGSSNTPVAVEPSATNYPTIKVYYNTK